MNPEKQRIAIAEACGWTAIEDIDGFWRAVDASGYVTTDLWISESNVWSAGMPDYLNDLNAMRGASDTLNDDQQWQFVQHLNEITRIKHDSDSDDWFIHRTDWIWRMLNATAAQRAEAFLRTIGKWEEGK